MIEVWGNCNEVMVSWSFDRVRYVVFGCDLVDWCDWIDLLLLEEEVWWNGYGLIEGIEVFVKREWVFV